MLSYNECLADFCEAAGVPMKASYKVRELAMLLDLDPHTIYDEISGGRLRAFMPKGVTKGRRIRACEVNRWLEEAW